MDTSKTRSHVRTALIYLAPIAALLALTTLLNTTNPVQGGPLSILAVFVLLYLLIFSVTAAAVHFIGAVMRMVRPTKSFSLRRAYYVLSVVSLAPVLLVALNTLGQLEILEIMLILVLVGLGCFYVVRRTVR